MIISDKDVIVTLEVDGKKIKIEGFADGTMISCKVDRNREINNDRELVEMASKACGWIGYWGEVHNCGDSKVDLSGVWFLDGEPCDPLNDYGWAMRVAEILNFSVNFSSTKTIVYAEMPNSDFIEDRQPCRAILRAAAEIGKGLSC